MNWESEMKPREMKKKKKKTRTEKIIKIIKKKRILIITVLPDEAERNEK